MLSGDLRFREVRELCSSLVVKSGEVGYKMHTAQVLSCVSRQ